MRGERPYPVSTSLFEIDRYVLLLHVYSIVETNSVVSLPRRLEYGREECEGRDWLLVGVQAQAGLVAGNSVYSFVENILIFANSPHRRV